MAKELKINLVRVQNSRFWAVRFTDPNTGRTIQKSTGTSSKKEAERFLGELRGELLTGRYASPSKITWESFRERYEEQVLPGLALKTQLKVATIFNAVESLISPERLRDLTAERLSTFQAKLREGKRTETTIAGYMAHLRSALKWAVAMDLLASLPKIKRVQRAKRSNIMKGRPISQEEFERMLAKSADIVGDAAASSWTNYLKGLWWSGLRLAESLELYWDDDAKLCVTAVGADLMLRIPAELEKGNKDRLLPIAPEFATFLTETPIAGRTGRVFKLVPRKVRGERLTADRVTRIVSAIGRAANVAVDKGRNKFATAHDLRRSFGERWADRVMPQVLMVLMRHESIDTTLRYYVGHNAQRTTLVLKEALADHQRRSAGALGDKKGDTLGDTHPNEATETENATP
jgi:integrase